MAKHAPCENAKRVTTVTPLCLFRSKRRSFLGRVRHYHGPTPPPDFS